MPDISISRFIASINNDWLTGAGMLLNDSFIFGALVISIGLFFERELKDRLRLAGALVITIVLVSVLKMVLAIERPCAHDGSLLCPLGYSLPSLHAAIAFTLMFAFLGKRTFPLVFAFAIFVAFTRLNLGVHNFEDVAAALPVAFIAFYLSDNISRKLNPTKKAFLSRRRKS